MLIHSCILQQKRNLDLSALVLDGQPVMFSFDLHHLDAYNQLYAIRNGTSDHEHDACRNVCKIGKHNVVLHHDRNDYTHACSALQNRRDDLLGSAH